MSNCKIICELCAAWDAFERADGVHDKRAVDRAIKHLNKVEQAAAAVSSSAEIKQNVSGEVR